MFWREQKIKDKEKYRFFSIKFLLFLKSSFLLNSLVLQSLSDTPYIIFLMSLCMEGYYSHLCLCKYEDRTHFFSRYLRMTSFCHNVVIEIMASGNTPKSKLGIVAVNDSDFFIFSRRSIQNKKTNFLLGHIIKCCRTTTHT